MKKKIVLILILIAGVLLISGCVDNLTGEAKQKCLERCDNTHNGCISGCGNYWLQNERQSCEGKCNADYANCKLDC